MVKIIDFWAEWCGPCKMMEPILDQVEEELKEKVTIEKINVDEHQDIASQYGVLGIPTYVVLQDDKEVDRIIGFTQKDTFVDRINKYLN